MTRNSIHEKRGKTPTRLFASIVVTIGLASGLFMALNCWTMLSTKPHLSGAAIAYKEIPGLQLNGLSEPRRLQLLAQLNRDACPCGCGDTIAHCRHIDPKCQEGLHKAQALLIASQT